MSDEIKPALTAEEWRQIHRAASGEYSAPIMAYGVANHMGYMYAGRRHALGALCLYGQPFGFTREDVDTLLTARRCLDDYERPLGDPCDAWGRVSDIAARLAALLPSKDVKP